MLGNAGIIHDYKKTWQLDEDGFRNVLEVNVVGVWHTVEAAVPHMIEQGDGGMTRLGLSPPCDHGADLRGRTC